ncbi:MAG: RHS repeat-associated core domain-containing protein, partial [Ghiorsea sp.]|nr:RHS repeat-associated core domain-containing protein [Ghiorsea sp.]
MTYNCSVTIKVTAQIVINPKSSFNIYTEWRSKVIFLEQKARSRPDATGMIVQQFVYDPWGKQYNVQSNAIFNAYSSPAISQGYTGHKMVNDLEVIHMNGRIYDPTLGRFLQADPHIQAPKNSQSYNRYSYVLNNPMSYTDPSGYFFKAIGKFLKKNWRTIVAIAASYVTFGLATGAWTFAAASNLGAAALIGGGAAAGFVSGAISTGSLRGALQGAFSGALFGAIGGAGLGKFGAFAASGVAGGVMSDLQGGKFGHGFISAGIGAVAGGAFGKAPMARIIGSAVVGGTVSKLTGGKFANGAMTAAFAAALRSDWGGNRGKGEAPAVAEATS